jgi:hypothetical protein
VFVELEALSHSESAYYLIMAFGFAYVVPTQGLRAAVENRQTIHGGDWLSATGVLLTESELRQVSLDVV